MTLLNILTQPFDSAQIEADNLDNYYKNVYKSASDPNEVKIMKLNICKKYYPNGTTQAEYTENNQGQKHGISQDWYPNGQLWEQCEYTNGKLNGCRVVFTYDGITRRIEYWANGVHLQTTVYLIDHKPCLVPLIQIFPNFYTSQHSERKG